MKRVVAIILAAGSSSRLGQPKQLLMVDGEALLQRGIRIAREAGAEPVFVVLGAHRESIEKSIDFGTAAIVVNERWEDGIGSSVRAGVEAVRSGVSDDAGVLFLTCDQPRVTVRHLRQMMDRFSDSPEAAVASVYAGARGIPAIFPLAAFAELCALQGDKGARGLLLNSPWPVIEVSLEGGEIDIDRPEDLTQLA